MADQVLLGGKVRILSLPTFAGSPGGVLPLMKRLFLAQGELAQFHDGSEPIRYLAAIELRPGTIRGNHYHREKKEYLYVITGELDLFLGDAGSGQKETVGMLAGDLAVLSPGVAHALRPTAAGVAVEFSPTLFDPADTHRFQLT